MKRKIFALILVLTMALALCACGQSGDIEKTVREAEDKLTSMEDCHLVVQLTIGHKLELYLDEAGTVLNAAAGDEDGTSFLAGLELMGLSYDDAVHAVLSCATEQGLLTDNANVQIHVLASAEGPLTWEQTQELQQAVTDYNATLVPYADQSVVVAADCGAEKVSVEELPNGDIFYDYYVNNRAVRQACYRTDGSYTEWIYDDEGVNALATINVTADGRRSEERSNYENDVLVSKTHIIQEGDYTTTEEKRYEDGVLASSTRITQKGDYTVTEEERYEDGQISYSCMKDSEGFCGETSYYSDGRMKSQKESGTDGSVKEQRYDEEGKQTYNLEVWDGRSIERYYYTNGNPKSVEERDPDGEFYVYRYTAYEEDGSYCIEEEAKDGSILRSEYNAEGMNTYYRYTYANGDWEELAYYPNGRIKTEAGSVGGEEYSRQYDENGVIVED